MDLADFDYALPAERIAQYPPACRRDARLLVVGEGGALRDGRIAELPALVRSGDLVVLNDTRVIRARLAGRKESGGAVEILIERVLSDTTAAVHLRASKTPRAGSRIRIEPHGEVRVTGREGALFLIETGGGEPLADLVERCGHVPLPPYIDRPDEPLDAERYQTVFAAKPGAVAAPTAGLHLDRRMLDELAAAGVSVARVTLHVGAGTFQPIRPEDGIEGHAMHPERVEVTEQVCEAIGATRARGGRVVAVGTTVVRALESAALATGEVEPFRGETRLFIRPGFAFRAVDALLTNFHQPRSTLLLLVCAFAGREAVLDAYRHALAHGYRFLSYGDAMWMTRGETA